MYFNAQERAQALSPELHLQWRGAVCDLVKVCSYCHKHSHWKADSHFLKPKVYLSDLPVKSAGLAAPVSQSSDFAGVLFWGDVSHPWCFSSSVVETGTR